MTLVIRNMIRILAFLPFMALAFFSGAQSKSLQGIKHIDYFFENASPLSWCVQGDSMIRISLLADYERERFNRQTDHWHFRVDAIPGTRIKLLIAKTLPDIYNGNPAKEWWNSPNGTSCYISYDRKTWDAIKTVAMPNNELLVDFITHGNSVYIARLPVYTAENLELLKRRIMGNPLVEFIPIGHTVEKRPLEIIRMGNPEAKHSILIRARAHPWEPGGNWVIEGLINEFLKNNIRSGEWRKQFCLYILPMANKDGVFHGMTRFNTAGRDLNRNWLANEPDTINAPENYALLQFATNLINKKHNLSLAIDMHNDNYGDVHLTIPKKEDNKYLEHMELLKQFLNANTWFAQNFRQHENLAGGGDMADGMYYRFGIDAFIFELNANYIKKLDKMPEIADYMDLGAGLNETFYQYLISKKD